MAKGTTRGKRRMGRFLRSLRAQIDETAEVVAPRASCSHQTLYRVEAGGALPSRLRVEALLDALGASAQERERAWQLYEVADLDIVIEHIADLPKKYLRFRMDESEATGERSLDMIVIPGMFQTAAYATEISAAARRLATTPNWPDHAANERLERKALVAREISPLCYHGLIAESTLHNMIGNADVMEEQLDQLLKMMELPNVTIQVIPFDFGAHGALSGPLTLLDYEDEESAAYVESIAGLVALQVGQPTQELSAVWEDVASAAASPRQSAEMIRIERDRYRKYERTSNLAQEQSKHKQRPVRGGRKQSRGGA